jgi:uncharacterized protein YukE
MAWKTVTKKRSRSIIPDEAPGIAASLRSAAAKVRGLSQDLRQTGAELEGNWEGNSKIRFMDTFQSEPGDLESYAAWLESTASRIESMKVTVWESYEEKIWEPDPTGEGGS